MARGVFGQEMSFEVTRRDFLKTAGAGAAGAALREVAGRSGGQLPGFHTLEDQTISSDAVLQW